MKEYFININSIGKITDFKDGKVTGIALHADGFYDYQIKPTFLKPVESYTMKLRKAGTYQQALAIIGEEGRLL